MRASGVPPRVEAFVSVALTVAAVVFFAHQVRAVAWPVVDDAAISAAFATTALEGHGFRATAPSQPVEAFSNPAWTVALMASAPLHVPILRFAQGASVLLAALAVLLLGQGGAWGEDRWPRLEDAAAPWLLASCPDFAGWASSGMELGLYAFLYVAAVLGAQRAWRGKSAVWLGAALGFLCLTRPEALLFAALVWSAFALSQRRDWKAVAVATLSLALSLLPWLTFRWIYFADFLPNSFWAKQTWDFQPSAYLEGFGKQYVLLLAAGLLGAVLAAATPARRPGALLAAAFIAVEVLFTWRARGDWMGEWRFLTPILPALGALTAAGIGALRELRSRHAGALGLLVLLALSVAAGVADTLDTPRVQRASQFPYAYVAGQSRSLRRWIRLTGERHPRVALPDLGGLSMELREAEIIDLAGLADYALAHQSRSVLAQEDYLVSEGVPALVDIHGPSGGLRNFPSLMRQLRPLAPPLYIVAGLDAEHDPRCPGGKGTVLQLRPEQLLQVLREDIRRGDGTLALARWRCAAAYQDAPSLPTREERLQLADAAEIAAHESERTGRQLRALRLASLATILSDGEAHRRRYTETLRAPLFPPAP